ncbi:uncharacterized protein AMSG_03504 [Thecamonas trahens ATCC 50062]|uniref:Copper transport protein n=1 Tax=Thecamonas trahens ATCC 50062 TaxID=461836 RepID=A0A0L0D445_THETB|nr:hypothetical protein AMSG_03504 [Thecamonas trahens ATCC 50062]KNC47079.1 hypothetical protein AMSG_03504 [Thecamonas trahens ATCC 50062]|eukprot:XP_013759859.1 hypothetical protein AMSG_03504 [Thecamonas trahens ATCC 50062]
MQMWFTLETSDLGHLLFHGWKVESTGALVFAAAVSAVMAAVFTFVKSWLVPRVDAAARIAAIEASSSRHTRLPPLAGAWAHESVALNRSAAAVYSGADSGRRPLIAGMPGAMVPGMHEPARPFAPWLWQLVRAGTHVLHITIGYAVMLIAMSYSAWLFFAILAGVFVGYLVANLAR